jgi:poly-gamma-glutamate synthesis protein (capsule biosynthesis protein)
MSNSLLPVFTIVEAKTLGDRFPTDLLGLIVAERDAVAPQVTVCSVGDLGLSGRAAKTIRQGGSGSLFADVAGVLRSADLTFGNLESPLAGELSPGNMFAAPVSGAHILRDCGFGLIHLANNHVGEYGQRGLAATLHAISDAGMVPLGAGKDRAQARRLVRTTLNSVRIGWLGCGHTLLSQPDRDEQYWEFAENELVAEIERARPEVDVLIVSIHIGMMYIDYPRPDHKLLAERLMAVGANLVLMHHAHVLQSIQVTEHGEICCYNLGNFLYDWEEGNVLVPIMVEEQNQGGIFQFWLDKLGVAKMAVLPTWIDENCCVRWATGEKGRKILERLIRISEDLKHDFVAKFEAQRAERNMGPILKVLAFHASRLNWRYLLSAVTRMRIEHFKMLVRWLGARSQ